MLCIFLASCAATYLFSFFTFGSVHSLLAACWLIFAYSLAKHLAQNKKVAILLLAVLCIVVIGFLMPKWLTILILYYPNSLLDSVGWSISAGKVAHITVYTMLGIFYVLLMRSLHSHDQIITRVVLTMCLFSAAFMSELVQLYVDNRSSSAKDLGYNFIGISLGVAVTIFYNFIVGYQSSDTSKMQQDVCVTSLKDESENTSTNVVSASQRS